MPRCLHCKRPDLPVDAFYKGQTGRCRECMSVCLRTNRKKRSSPDIIRNNTDAARARKRKWAAKNRDPLKEGARVSVRRAITRGDLIRPDSCPRCGAFSKRRDGVSAIQAHHHRGYEYPLDIEWLCARCHRKEHDAAIARGET